MDPSAESGYMGSRVNATQWQDGLDDDASECHRVGNTDHLQTSRGIHIDVRGKEIKKNSEGQRDEVNIKTTEDSAKDINTTNKKDRK